jgi:hypothetical protein
LFSTYSNQGRIDFTNRFVDGFYDYWLSVGPVRTHARILEFVQRNMFGNVVQAIYPDGMAVFDSLVLLELSEYRCGVAARISLEPFAASEGNPG